MGEASDNDLLFRVLRHHLARRAAVAWRDIDGGMPVARWLWRHFPEVDQFADVLRRKGLPLYHTALRMRREHRDWRRAIRAYDRTWAETKRGYDVLPVTWVGTDA